MSHSTPTLRGDPPSFLHRKDLQHVKQLRLAVIYGTGLSMILWIGLIEIVRRVLLTS